MGSAGLAILLTMAPVHESKAGKISNLLHTVTGFSGLVGKGLAGLGAVVGVVGTATGAGAIPSAIAGAALGVAGTVVQLGGNAIHNATAPKDSKAKNK